MRPRPSNRCETTSARKWSPPPVRSSTWTAEPGNACSMRCFRSSVVGTVFRGYPWLQLGQMVTLTSIAAEKVRGFLETQDTAGLRVGVRGGGCSGFQYALALDEPSAEDRIFDVDGIKVIVDEASLTYVDGSEVDYTESLMGSGFQVNNPNVVASCGCGSSFRIPDEQPSRRPAPSPWRSEPLTPQIRPAGMGSQGRQRSR